MIFFQATTSSQIIGYMYEFDCKPVIHKPPKDAKWVSIAFEKQVIRSLRKHAYSSMLKILAQKKKKKKKKNENCQIKNSDIFHICAQNINCGYSLEPPRRSGSNEYPHSMFLSRNKKNNVYPL